MKDFDIGNKKNRLAIVKSGVIRYTSGELVAVGSWAWFKWLEDSATRSFRFADCGGFTCRKEPNGYWYFYKKIQGKLRKRYIGKSSALTMARLTEVAGVLNRFDRLRDSSSRLSSLLPRLIDPLSWLRIPFSFTRLLPTRSGVYFVLTQDGLLHYIGSSKNMMLSWNSPDKSHDRQEYFEGLESLGIPVYIAIYPCSDYQDVEERLILQFKPYLNEQPKSVNPEQMREYWEKCLSLATVR